jgi:membrane-bound serine protease (ClpP class)
MKAFLAGLLVLLGLVTGEAEDGQPTAPSDKKAYIIPVREDVATPLAYLVRRGVKEAMEAEATVLILDMDTNGGRVDVTEEIIEILGQFRGATVTFVNRKAFSAGAFIAVATQKIYMAEGSVIGAAAPILMAPGGAGVENMPDTLEAKMTSGISALVRARAEQNGHNAEVIEAMIDKNKELIIDGEVLNEKGQILTLTNRQAEKTYGQPPQPLLSAGTVESLDQLLKLLDLDKSKVLRVEPLGAEKLAGWLNSLSPILLIIGIVGLYIEFKTPGFGLPGIVGLSAFALYFMGGYVAGLAGLEWAVVFLVGLGLVLLELLVFTGTAIPGLVGAALMLIAIIMGTVDLYPGMPPIPTLPQLQVPIRDLLVAVAGGGLSVYLISRILPRTPIYGMLVSHSTSGEGSVRELWTVQESQIGREGVALSNLRPGGKAQFEDVILDVITQGDLIPKGTSVRIISHSGREAVVEPARK